MRKITTHHTNDANRRVFVFADERDPNNGNASHEYHVGIDSEGTDGQRLVPRRAYLIIPFQHGPIKENGVNGVTNEVLLAVLIDRLEGFQSSKYANEYNETALNFCRGALVALEERTREREKRGVEGTHNV